jgi:hypothetical protein
MYVVYACGEYVLAHFRFKFPFQIALISHSPIIHRRFTEETEERGFSCGGTRIFKRIFKINFHFRIQVQIQ